MKRHLRSVLRVAHSAQWGYQALPMYFVYILKRKNGPHPRTEDGAQTEVYTFTMETMDGMWLLSHYPCNRH